MHLLQAEQTLGRYCEHVQRVDVATLIRGKISRSLLKSLVQRGHLSADLLQSSHEFGLLANLLGIVEDGHDSLDFLSKQLNSVHVRDESRADGGCLT